MNDQLDLGFNDIRPKPTKSLVIIQCFECKAEAELDGYRFQFVPLCCCCRTEREVQITNNRFERRNSLR